mmetsp:Transcript_41421/g.81694  ORF Transcript_41421/g.81694 Transcript_41421/m.81694 type:complete len:362 (-) Transcript_41421:104-1189(-)
MCLLGHCMPRRGLVRFQPHHLDRRHSTVCGEQEKVLVNVNGEDRAEIIQGYCVRCLPPLHGGELPCCLPTPEIHTSNVPSGSSDERKTIRTINVRDRKAPVHFHGEPMYFLLGVEDLDQLNGGLTPLGGQSVPCHETPRALAHGNLMPDPQRRVPFVIILLQPLFVISSCGLLGSVFPFIPSSFVAFSWLHHAIILFAFFSVCCLRTVSALPPIRLLPHLHKGSGPIVQHVGALARRSGDPHKFLPCLEQTEHAIDLSCRQVVETQQVVIRRSKSDDARGVLSTAFAPLLVVRYIDHRILVHSERSLPDQLALLVVPNLKEPRFSIIERAPGSSRVPPSVRVSFLVLIVHFVVLPLFCRAQ